MLTEAILRVTLAHTCIYACKEIQNPEFGKFLIKNGLTELVELRLIQLKILH